MARVVKLPKASRVAAVKGSVTTVPALYYGYQGFDFIAGDVPTTFTRASVGSRMSPAGVIEDLGNDVLRYEYDYGNAITNLLPNSGLVGASLGVVGSGGSLPNGWVISGQGGLTAAVVALSTDYIDIRLSGTVTAGGQSLLSMEPGYMGAIGDTYTYAVDVGKSGGTLPSNVWLRPNESGGDTVALTPSSNALTRVVKTWSQATTNARMQIRWLITLGATYDFTLRIGRAQREAGVVSNRYVRTTGSAATDAALLGLLVEATTTNMWINSRDVSTKPVSNMLASSATAIMETATTATHFFTACSISAPVVGDKHTFSFITKPIGASPRYIQVRGSNSTVYGGILFLNVNPSNGQVATTSTGIEAYGSYPVGGGRYMVWFRTSGIVDASTTISLRVYCSPVFGDITASAGDVNSGIYIEEGQLEPGYLSSRIRTAGAEVTRANDIASLNWGAKGVPNGTVTLKYYLSDGTTKNVATNITGGLAQIPRAVTMYPNIIRKVERLYG